MIRISTGVAIAITATIMLALTPSVGIASPSPDLPRIAIQAYLAIEVAQVYGAPSSQVSQWIKQLNSFLDTTSSVTNSNSTLDDSALSIILANASSIATTQAHLHVVTYLLEVVVVVVISIGAAVISVVSIEHFDARRKRNMMKLIVRTGPGKTS